MKLNEVTINNLTDYLKLEYAELPAAEIAFIGSLKAAAENYIMSYTGLTTEEAITFDDLTIVLFVLVQDMYDTRSMYVEKGNLNKVVETILGLHARNLL